MHFNYSPISLSSFSGIGWYVVLKSNTHTNILLLMNIFTAMYPPATLNTCIYMYTATKDTEHLKDLANYHLLLKNYKSYPNFLGHLMTKLVHMDI